MFRGISYLVLLFICGLALATTSLPTSAADDVAATGAQRTVLLTSREPDTEQRHNAGKLLVRELLRQAVLIAARDELGLATRDMTLRESWPAENGAIAGVIDARTAETVGKSVRLTLAHKVEDGEKIVFDKEIPLPAINTLFDYVTLTAIAEELSRTELPAALKEAGFSGDRHKAEKTVKLDNDITAQLGEMNFLSQLTALRALHELQRAGGESPQTLGAIVRAYAHLGVLTSFHWNAAHKAFRARSLLYAQRLVQAEKQSAGSLRHRAYAMALAGLPVEAIADLKAADEAAGTNDESLPTPWLPLIDKLCRYDFQGFQKEAPPDQYRELAALLAFMTVENSSCEGLTLVTGRDVLTIAPECYFVCEAMGRMGGVSNRHMTTAHGPETMLRTLPGRLSDMIGLPKTVSDELKAVAEKQEGVQDDPALACGLTYADTTRKLLAAGQPGLDLVEPSWECVGRMIEDVTFAHIYTRFNFFKRSLALPGNAYAREIEVARTVLRDHPYLPMVQCIPLDANGNARDIRNICEKLDVVDAGFPCAPFLTSVTASKDGYKDLGPRTRLAMYRHMDELAPEFEQIVEYADGKAFARRLLMRCPHSPQAVALVVKYDPEFARKNIPQWQEEFANQPAVLKALGTRFRADKQYAEAARCLEKYIEIAPDQASYADLADAYWAQGEEGKWKQTLLASLDQEDFRLSHAMTRVKLARYHLKRKELDEAVAYADEAASTGAAWAMLCAGRCHEALGHWDQAEQLVRATSERYSESQLDWFIWCRRTDRGDGIAAKDLAMRRTVAMQKRGTKVELMRVGLVYILAGDRDGNASGLFNRVLTQFHDLNAAVFALLLFDEEGNVAQRDEILKGVATAPMPPKPDAALLEVRKFIKWLDQAFHQPADAEYDLATVDALEFSESVQREIVYYSLGRFFAHRKKYDLARNYLERAIKVRDDGQIFEALAQVQLRNLAMALEDAAEAANPQTGPTKAAVDEKTE